MNINSFPNGFGKNDLRWDVVFGFLAGIPVDFRFPYYVGRRSALKTYPDWQFAKVKTIAWINDRVSLGKKGARMVWSGVINNDNQAMHDHLLLLELPPETITIDGKTCHLVATPYGRPGNPATILIDSSGEIVPELFFPERDMDQSNIVRVYPLSHTWNKFGWEDKYPAIGLQFAKGICVKPNNEVAKWQSFMMRNQA